MSKNRYDYNMLKKDAIDDKRNLEKKFDLLFDQNLDAAVKEMVDIIKKLVFDEVNLYCKTNKSSSIKKMGILFPKYEYKSILYQRILVYNHISEFIVPLMNRDCEGKIFWNFRTEKQLDIFLEKVNKELKYFNIKISIFKLSDMYIKIVANLGRL